MTYDYFLMQMEQLISVSLKKGERIRGVRILKNNGIKMDGFAYQADGHREQPTVYVNHFYREDLSQAELGEIAEYILKVQRNSILFPEKGLSEALNDEKIKDQIYYRLISQDKNKELLEQVPWVPWLDLAIVFYLRIPEHIIKGATALIYTSHIEHWGIDPQELFEIASKNMGRLPVKLEAMEQILDEHGYPAANRGMYVLGIKDKDFGAAAIVNPDVQKLCFQKLGGDYYVLPSSVHELILLPVSSGADYSELNAMIRGINERCVDREDCLSDRAYRYISKLERIE